MTRVVSLLAVILTLLAGPTGCSTLQRFFLSQQATIVLEPDETYQTITGWEATAWIGQFDRLMPSWRDEVLDRAANELGINRLRLEIRSGAENPTDFFSQMINEELDFSKWRPHMYELINDNDDPQVINKTGFQFSELDLTIENVVIPLQKRLAAKGEHLYVTLTIVDFVGHDNASNIGFYSHPEEYAEFVLAAFLHIDRQYGWVPDAVEVILEPDVAQWQNGTNVGRALAAAGRRLEENGYKNVDFIAPSNTDLSSAIRYFDQMIQVPGVLDYLSEFSYHRYRGVSDKNLEQIKARADEYGLRTAHLEKIGAGYHELHQDLKLANNSAWAQYALAGAPDDNSDRGGLYYIISVDEAGLPHVKLGRRTYFLRQYFKYIQAGATRVRATTTNPDFDPLAFLNPDGRYVIVIKAATKGTISLQGLPTGTYGVSFIGDNQYYFNLPSIIPDRIHDFFVRRNIDLKIEELSEVTLNTGQLVDIHIPQKGVITIHAKPVAVSDKAVN